MINQKRLFVLLIVLSLLSLSCNLSGLLGSGDGEPDPDAVATSVAATLAAIGGGSGAGGTPTGLAPEGLVTDTPIPQPLQVVYGTDSQLWIWTEGSGTAMLYSGERVLDVRISADGQRVAFFTDSGGLSPNLRTVNSDGSNLSLAIDAAGFAAMATNPTAVGLAVSQVEFVPGSHTLAFNTRHLYEGPGLDKLDEIRLLEVDSGVVSLLLAPDTAGDFYYSPDCSQIALMTPTDIDLINADGSNRRDNVVVYPSVITYSEFQYYPIPRWAADSSHLMVAIPSADILAVDPTVEVWDIPLDGSLGVSLGLTSSLSQLFVRESTISPDLNLLAISRHVGPPTDNIRDIQFVNLTTFGIDFYDSGMHFEFINWKPDSSRFVYKTNFMPEIGELGGVSIPAGDVPEVRDVVWVNSSTYLFTSGSGSNWNLHISPLLGPSALIAGPSTNFIPFDISN